MGRIPPLMLNPAPKVERQPIGGDYFCLVVDDFFLNPEGLREWALAFAADFQFQERAYPGLVLPLEEDQARVTDRFVRRWLSQQFGFLRGDVKIQNQFSLTTLQPEDFTWIQRLPHSDPRLAPERANIATVAYLFHDEALGGTGFYRWKDPEYWQAMSERQQEDPQAGLDEIVARFKLFREPPKYVAETNDVVELLTVVPAKFNRLICYNGDLPHSAHIEHPERLSENLSDGRLTLNSFASVLPRS